MPEKVVSRPLGLAVLSINYTCAYKINSVGMKASMWEITFSERYISCNQTGFLQAVNL